jgi:hypothetical protein
MMAALAGVVHNGQGASGHKHNGGDDNQQGGFHRDLATAGPPNPFKPQINRSSNERAMNKLKRTEV